MTQHVRESTRGNNILDLILTQDKNLVNNVLIKAPIFSSDHNTIQGELIFPNQYCLKIKPSHYDYLKGDYDKFNNALHEGNWTDLFSSNDVTSNWNKFKSILFAEREKFIPFVKCKISNSKNAK